MSATASFFLFDTAKLDALKQNAEIIVKKSFFTKTRTDNYWKYLTTDAIELESIGGSGHIYANLFVFLQEQKHIDLFTNQYENIAKELMDKRGISHFLFSHEVKELHLAQLEPSLFSLEELQKFNEDFSEDGDIETAKATVEAIKVLHDNLGKIKSDNQILLLMVG